NKNFSAEVSIEAPAVRLTDGGKQMRNVNTIKPPTISQRSRRELRQAGRVVGVGAVLAGFLSVIILSIPTDIVQNATDILCPLLCQASEGNLIESWQPAELQSCRLTVVYQGGIVFSLIFE